MKLDITKHVLVPKHTKVSAKEKEELYKSYNITNRELPKINKNDPAIKAFGAKAGDVIKIERVSPTAGEHIFYRGVTDE